ncbi:hypothetical protein F5Y18DRAFT_271100 [Xylariaceae sp. FL1019]|nr:hypothetical protein F5Y18DRAFT_271100 [Xylariaceae sp. FL1019]
MAVESPLVTIPLLAGALNPAYATMRPNLSLFIPPNDHPTPVQVSPDHSFVIEMDREEYDSGTCSTCAHASRGSAYCDYCFQYEIHHNGAYNQSQPNRWRPTDFQEQVTWVEYFVRGEMALIALLVPLTLLFVVRVYWFSD